MSKRITGKINLKQLKHFEQTTSKGKKYICIPYEENKIFLGEKGAYLPFVAFEYKEPREHSSHYIRQSVSKEESEKMTEEEKKAVPFLGELKLWDNTPSEPAPNTMPVDKDFAVNEDDLPF